MRIFLTGATGYVGSVIAEKLLERGHQVLGLARNDIAESKLVERGITPHLGDLTDLDSLKRGALNSDAVIHTAFGHDFANFGSMVEIERNAINAFAEALTETANPLIATNGTAFLGDSGENAFDENQPAHPGIFGYERYTAQQEFLKTAERGVRSVMIRLPFYVYGRGGSVFLPALIPAARANDAAYYVESGAQRVSAVHVEDAAESYILALENHNARGLYNISAEIVTNKQIAAAIGELVGVRAESISVDAAREKFSSLIGFLTISNALSADKARRELGWQPDARNSILDDIVNGSYRAEAAQ